MATFTTATQSNNSWSSGFTVSSSDFQSLDLTLATIDRNADGSIPETKLFRLKSTSALIDKGVDVGLPYLGAKPDLGAFEYAPIITGIWEANLSNDNALNFKTYPNPAAHAQNRGVKCESRI